MLIHFYNLVGGKMKCFRLHPKVILWVAGVLNGWDGRWEEEFCYIYSLQESV